MKQIRTITIEYMVSADAKTLDAKKFKAALDKAAVTFLKRNTDAKVYVSAIEKEGKTVSVSKPVVIRATKGTCGACKPTPVNTAKKVNPRCTCKKGIVKCSCGFHHDRPEWKKANKGKKK